MSRRRWTDTFAPLFPTSVQTFARTAALQDAALTASKMGMRKDRSLDMADSGEGAKSAYESTSGRINNARQTGTIGEFQEQDRERQEEAARSTSEE